MFEMTFVIQSTARTHAGFVMMTLGSQKLLLLLLLSGVSRGGRWGGVVLLGRSRRGVQNSLTKIILTTIRVSLCTLNVIQNILIWFTWP